MNWRERPGGREAAAEAGVPSAPGQGQNFACCHDKEGCISSHRPIFGDREIEKAIKKKDNGFSITLNPRLHREAEAVLDLLRDPAGLDGAQVIKKNMVRTVLNVAAGEARFIVKKYHAAGFVNVLKGLVLPTRARTEWSVMRRFNALGIPTAEPVLFGEKRRFGLLTDSFFVSTFLAGTFPLGPYSLRLRREGRWNESIKKTLFEELAVLTARLHEASIFHADFHLGNVLVRDRGESGLRLYVIDLHTVSFPRRLEKRRILLNLARVSESLRQLGQGSVRNFLEMYLERRPGFPVEAKILEEAVARRVASLDRRKLASRTRRCLVRSTKFSLVKAGGYRINMRRTYTPDAVLKAIRIHDTVSPEGDDRLIPPSNKNKVTVIDVMDRSTPLKLCVKEYRPRSLLRRLLPVPSEAKRSWIAGLGLEVRGIPTPETVAWVRGRGREFAVTRYIEGATGLHKYAQRRLAALDSREHAAFLRRLAAGAARFVRKMHEAGVCHHDLCDQNILVRNGREGRIFFLADLDTVSFAGRISERRVVKNLVQLGHLPGDVGVIVKARFLKFYLGQDGAGRFSKLFARIDRGILRRMSAKRKRFLKRGEPDPHPLPSALKKTWS